jgi:transcription elongation GreA/GreB family factor
MQHLKEQLLKACIEYVQVRANTVDEIITNNQKALSSETKSSAGDKHETGRAMLQLEMEKAGQQLTSINQMRMVLARINLAISTSIKLGSLIRMNHANYFLAISAGEIKIDGVIYYAISPSSPIGKLLLGKQVNETINFTKEMLINAIY